MLNSSLLGIKGGKSLTDLQFEECIVRIKQGDKFGLEDIYRDYIKVIYHTILGVVKNKEAAEDLTSEFFLKLWRSADKYKAGKGHKQWILIISKNMALDYLRKNKHEELVSDFEDNIGKEEIGFDRLITEELSMAEVLMTLDSDEREIINLKVLLGFTFKDISTYMEKPMGTVTWKYQNAIKKLRRCNYE